MGGYHVSAQQLPNVGFETWKETCGQTTTTWNGISSFARPGIEPEGWNGSNVTQVLPFPDFIKQGGNESDRTCLMTNQKPGLGSLSAPAPAFITMGTPWIFAKISFDPQAIAAGDGGVYGGVACTVKPDAIVGKYKRNEDAGDEDAHIIFYLWNGEYRTKVTSDIDDSYQPSATVELTDVDRAIVGKMDEANVLSKGNLIAFSDYVITSNIDEFEEIVVPIDYVEGMEDETPEKMNVIISAADYWTRANIVPNNTLEADSVRLVYYSTLEGITLDGTPLDGFVAGTYTYEMEGTSFPEQIEGTAKSPRATVAVEKNETEKTITLTVTNQGGEDLDGATEHVYTLHYGNLAGVTSVEGLQADVYGGNGYVAVSGFAGQVEVYSVDGRLLESVVSTGSVEIPLTDGLYIVRAGDVTRKVIVK